MRPFRRPPSKGRARAHSDDTMYTTIVIWKECRAVSSALAPGKSTTGGEVGSQTATPIKPLGKESPCTHPSPTPTKLASLPLIRNVQ